MVAATQKAAPPQAADAEPSFDVLALTRGMLRAMQMGDTRTKNSEALLEHLSKGGCLSDMYGLSEDDLEAVYAMARSLYNNRKYDDALAMFRFLCHLEHTCSKYWMGMGATQQMLKDYDAALNAYGMATLYDIDDPRPQLQAGFCLIQLGHPEEAAAALEGALLSKNATPATDIQAKALLARLDSEGAKASA